MGHGVLDDSLTQFFHESAAGSFVPAGSLVGFSRPQTRPWMIQKHSKPHASVTSPRVHCVQLSPSPLSVVPPLAFRLLKGRSRQMATVELHSYTPQSSDVMHYAA
jgi:hypothetical protein